MSFTKRYLLVYGAALLDPLIVLAYNPLVPVLKTEFGVTVDLIAISLSFHMFPFALLNLVSGTISDQYHRPTVLLYGLGLSTVGSILGAFAPSLNVLYLSRIIHGVGSAFIMPITMALVADLTAPSRMSQVIGIYGMFMGLGTTIGPLLGGYFASIEWRIVPGLLAVYSGFIAFLVRWSFRASGTFSSASRDKSPLTQQLRQPLRNWGVLVASLTGFLLFFTFQGIQPLLADYLSLPPLNIPKAEIGVFFAVIGAVGVLFAALSGPMSGIWGSRRTLLRGFAGILLPQLLLLVANSYESFLAVFAFFGCIQRILLTAAQTLTLESAGTAPGSASSIFNCIRYLGFAIAPTVMSSVYIAYGIRVLFVFNLSVLMIGGLGSWYLMRKIPSET